jgi:hypothetical protein
METMFLYIACCLESVHIHLEHAERNVRTKRRQHSATRRS